MQVVSQLPHRALQPYVACYWALTEAPHEEQTEHTILPMLGPELCFDFGAPYIIEEQDGRNPDFIHGSFVVGPTTHSSRMRSFGGLRSIFVRFRPGGLEALLPGLSAGELTNEFITFDHKELRPLADVRYRLYHVRTEAEQFALVEEALLERLRAADTAHTTAPSPNLLRQTLGYLRRNPFTQSVSEVADSMGLTLRTFEREFQRLTGMAPKRYLRLLRFHRAVELLGRSANSARPDWAAIAYACGFYDQAHLIREFKAFAWRPPVQYTQQDHEPYIGAYRANPNWSYMAAFAGH